MKQRKRHGWWCAWCETWVAEKDTAQETGDDQPIHLDCGTVVEMRAGIDPTPRPVSPDVRAKQDRHAQMVADFVRAAR